MSETYRMVQSTVTSDGEVRITIEEAPMLEPGPDEVVVAVEASPINPSDLGMLIAGADPASFASDGGALVGQLSPAAVAANAARVDQPMPCGNEGAGAVVLEAREYAEERGADILGVVSGIAEVSDGYHRLRHQQQHCQHGAFGI